MSWPLSQDYNEAIQDPRSSFADPELRDGQVTVNALGLPLPRSGNFADVYEFHCPKQQTRWALKCFTRKVAGLRERYSEISQCLRDAKLPFTVAFQYLEEGIRVRGQFYPLLKMRWVQGFLLNEFVRDNLDKPALVQNLGLIWQRMARRLREAGIAHADLQHGNVLLVPGATSQSLGVRLIDYDGMFVPAMAGKKSGEVGHPNYQHPQRLREGTYNGEVDRVPLLVVSAALRALSVGGRELWERHDNGDNLLFKESDLRAPADSELFRELLEMSDPLAKKLAGRLAEACELRLEDAPLLEELLPAEKPAAKAAARSSAAITATPPVEEFEEVPNWDFGQDEEEEPVKVRPKRKKRGEQEKGKVPMWAWAAGGAAALLVAGIGIGIALASRKGEDKTQDPAVAQNQNNPPHKDAGRNTDRQPPKERQAPPPKDAGKPPAGGVQPGLIAVGDEQRRLIGHVGPAHAVALSPDGRLGLSGGEDRTVRLWDVATGQEVHKISGLDGPVRSVAFSPDGSRFYASTGPKGLREWDTATRTDSGRVWRDGLRLSPDGVFSATREEIMGQPAIRVWRLATGKERLHFPAPPQGEDLVGAFSAGGRLMVVTGPRAIVQCDLQLGKGQRTVTDVERCLSVACSPDGNLAVLGPAEGLARVFDLTAHKMVRPFEWVSQKPFHSLAFLPDSRRILSGEENGLVRAWDVQTGKQLIAFSAHSGPVTAITVARDGLHALSAGRDGTVRLWDLTRVPPPAASAEPPAVANSTTLREHKWGYGIALSPDGRRLLSADTKGQVHIRNLATGQVEYTLKATRLNKGRIALVGDGRQLLYVSRDNVLQLLDCATETTVRRLGPPPTNVRFIDVSPDGRLALTGGGHTLIKDQKASYVGCELCLWDVREGKLLSTWKGHTTPVFTARFSADGRRVMSCGEDGIRVWEVAEGKMIKHLPISRAFNACVSADGRLVATCWGPDPIRLWDVETGKQTSLPARKGEVICLAFAGRDRLVSGGSGTLPVAAGKSPDPDPEQCVVRLWDVKTGQHLRTFKGHQHMVLGVAATPDGRLAISSSLDNTARLWDLSAGPTAAPEVPDGKADVAFTLPQGINGMILSADGQRLLLSDAGQQVWTRDRASRKPAQKVPGRMAVLGRRMAFLPGERRGLVVANDWVLREMDLVTGNEVRRFDQPAAMVRFVTASPDGLLALTGGGQSGFKDGKRTFDHCDLLLWDVAGGTRRAVWPGHTGRVFAARFTPDGRRVVSCGEDGIRVWEVPSGKPLKQVRAPSAIEGEVSADGRFVVLYCSDRSVRLWDVDKGKEVRAFATRKEHVSSVAVTAKGDRVLTGGTGHLPFTADQKPKPDPEQCVVRLWDVKSGQELRCFKGHTQVVSAVVVTPDGRQALSASGDGTVRRWDLQAGEAPAGKGGVVFARPNAINGIALSADARWLLVSDTSQQISVWDHTSRKMAHTVTGLKRVYNRLMVFLPGNRRALVVPMDYVPREVDLTTGNEVRRFDQPSPLAFVITLSPDGRLALSGGGQSALKDDKKIPEHCELFLWDVVRGKRLAAWTGHTEGVQAIRFTPDGRRVVSCGGDGIRVWEVAGGKQLKHVPMPLALRMAISADGRFVVTTCLDDSVRVWDVDKGKEVRAFTRRKDELVRCVALTPHGERMLMGCDGVLPTPPGQPLKTDPERCVVRLWDVKSGQELRCFKGHTAMVFALQVTPDGRQAFSAGWDNTVRLWDLPEASAVPPDKPAEATVREVRRFSGAGPFRSVGQFENGRVFGGAHSVLVWDVDNTDRPQSSVSIQGGCLRAVLSTKGDYVAYLTGERRVSVWSGGEQPRANNLPIQPQPLWDAAFVGAGEGLFTCGEEDNIRLWSLQSYRMLRTYPGHKGGVRSLAVSRDGAVLVSGGLKDGRVRVWDTKTARRRKDLPGHKGEVLSVGLSRDGKQLLSAGRDGSVRVRDFRTGNLIRRLTFPSLVACAWSPDGTRALVALPKGLVALCDLKTGTEVCRFQAHETSVLAVNFSRDGRQALTGGDKDVRLWELPKEALPGPGKRKP